MSDPEVARIAALVGQRFRTFGGGTASPGNPIAIALADRPLQFAAGVDVREVVRFVLDAAAVPNN